MQDIVASLLLWIAGNTGYQVDGLNPPEIVLMTPTELTAEYYSGSGLSGARRPDVDPRVMALYSFDEGPDGRIYIIAPEFTEGALKGEDPLENPIFQERLLHELVHHVQRHTGAYETFLCPAEGEIEAYRLGGAFLKARHADDPIPNRNFWARIYGRC